MECFSPLFVGAVVAMPASPASAWLGRRFSPLFVGAVVAICGRFRSGPHSLVGFSPLFVGAGVAMFPTICSSLSC